MPPKALVRDAIVDAIRAAGSMAGAAVSKRIRKPKQPKKRAPTIKPAVRTFVRTVTAPVNKGVVMRTMNGTRHTPFILSGNCYGGGFGITNTGAPYFVNNAGNNSSTNQFSVDPVGLSLFSYNFLSFASTVRSVASAFTRYRFRRLKMSYIPFVPTSQAGSIMIGASPEVAIGTNIAVDTVAGLQLKVQTPVWQTVTLDMLADGGLRKDWLFCDNNAASTEAAVRQEAAGILCFHVLGAPVTGSFYGLGSFFWDYEIEFDGVAINVAIVSPPAPPVAPADPSTSSSSSLTTIEIPQTPESEKWYIPGPGLDDPRRLVPRPVLK